MPRKSHRIIQCLVYLNSLECLHKIHSLGWKTKSTKSADFLCCGAYFCCKMTWAECFSCCGFFLSYMEAIRGYEMIPTPGLVAFQSSRGWDTQLSRLELSVAHPSSQAHLCPAHNSITPFSTHRLADFCREHRLDKLHMRGASEQVYLLQPGAQFEEEFKSTAKQTLAIIFTEIRA